MTLIRNQLTSSSRCQLFAGNDNETRVIILRSAGEKAFCAGASFDELISIKDKEQGTQFFNGFAHVINAMRKCPQFVIARVQGKCVGGGVGLAAAGLYHRPRRCGHQIK